MFRGKVGFPSSEWKSKQSKNPTEAGAQFLAYLRLFEALLTL
jgi:hypothetical protein